MLVSEPTLSELNTILMCLILMTQLHILESRQEHKTNSNCYSNCLFIVYCYLKFWKQEICHLQLDEEEEEEAKGRSLLTMITRLDLRTCELLPVQGMKNHRDEEETSLNLRDILPRTAQHPHTVIRLDQIQKTIPITLNHPFYLSSDLLRTVLTAILHLSS